jgi:copper(I)-binding protein
VNRLAASLILFLSCCQVLADDSITGLTVENARIREAPPTAAVLAGYMTLINTSGKSIRVTGVSSPDFAAAELHRTVVEDGVARMTPVEQLEVPAHERRVLEPGGLHLMLINPHQPLSDGDSVTLDLEDSAGGCLRISAPVQRMTGAGAAHHHHH